MLLALWSAYDFEPVVIGSVDAFQAGAFQSNAFQTSAMSVVLNGFVYYRRRRRL